MYATARRLKHPVTIIAMASALAACASQQERSDLSVKLGAAPSDEAAVQAIVETLGPQLKDPDSVKQFQVVSGPAPMRWYRGIVNGGGFDTGWLYCFQFNAKNSFGAYTGVTTRGIALRTATNGDAYVVPVNWPAADAHC
jgi:hypothetical protein